MDANQQFFKYFVYLPVVWARGQKVLPYLQRLLQTQYLDRADLELLQSHKLRRIVAYAKRSVPFFAKALARLPEDAIKTPADLAALPFTTKADLKSDPRSMSSRERLHLLTRKTTGGSTGEPVTVLKTRDAMAWELAATWRGYSQAGIDIGDRQGRFWGVPFGALDRARATLIDFVANRKRCSAFSFGEHELGAYADALAKFKPKYLYGYVSMIEEFAKHLQRTGRAPPPGLKCVITTSEVLTEYHRKLIEDVFAARVFNEYGSGELGSVAHECEAGSLHLSAENMIAEVIDGERTCAPGQTGELVVTELNNFATPLIRFRTGDFAALSSHPCRCGRTLPVLENVFGRAYDTLKSSNGRLFHGEFVMYIFEEAQRKGLGIRAFQVVQESPRSITVRVVPNESYGPSTEAFIAHRFRESFDPDAMLRFVRVDKIDRAPSGKMRLIIGMGADN